MPNANGESMYAGLRHPKAWGRKYERAEYVVINGMRVRKLMESERTEFADRLGPQAVEVTFNAHDSRLTRVLTPASAAAQAAERTKPQIVRTRRQPISNTRMRRSQRCQQCTPRQ